MADTATTPDPNATTTPEPPTERTVPYDRFKAVNDKLAEANRKAEEAEEKRQALEDKEKSDLEQAQSKLKKAEAKIAELTGEVESLGGKLASNERSGWVREAASAAKFIDPADALGRVDLSAIESKEDAEAAVKAVAKDAKHLVTAAEPTPPPVPGQVVAAGQPVTPDQQPVDPNAEENQKFLDELKAASAAGWSKSGEPLV